MHRRMHLISYFVKKSQFLLLYEDLFAVWGTPSEYLSLYCDLSRRSFLPTVAERRRFQRLWWKFLRPFGFALLVFLRWEFLRPFSFTLLVFLRWELQIPDFFSAKLQIRQNKGN